MQTVHGHHRTFGDDKRDHYTPLREMVPFIVRGSSENFRQKGGHASRLGRDPRMLNLAHKRTSQLRFVRNA
jgi:hypothetical protein